MPKQIPWGSTWETEDILSVILQGMQQCKNNHPAGILKWERRETWTFHLCGIYLSQTRLNHNLCYTA